MKTDEAKATKTGSAFRMDCAINATIHASPANLGPTHDAADSLAGTLP